MKEVTTIIDARITIIGNVSEVNVLPPAEWLEVRIKRDLGTDDVVIKDLKYFERDLED